MDNVTIVVLIEAVVFLIPLATLFVKLGKFVQEKKEQSDRIRALEEETQTLARKKDLEKLEEMHKHDVEIFQATNAQTSAILNSMNVEIAKISNTLQLMLKGKLITE